MRVYVEVKGGCEGGIGGMPGGAIPFRCSAIESQDSLAQNSRLSLAATTVPHQTLEYLNLW